MSRHRDLAKRHILSAVAQYSPLSDTAPSSSSASQSSSPITTTTTTTTAKSTSTSKNTQRSTQRRSQHANEINSDNSSHHSSQQQQQQPPPPSLTKDEPLAAAALALVNFAVHTGHQLLLYHALVREYLLAKFALGSSFVVIVQDQQPLAVLLRQTLSVDVFAAGDSLCAFAQALDRTLQSKDLCIARDSTPLHADLKRKQPLTSASQEKAAQPTVIFDSLQTFCADLHFSFDQRYLLALALCSASSWNLQQQACQLTERDLDAFAQSLRDSLSGHASTLASSPSALPQQLAQLGYNALASIDVFRRVLTQLGVVSSYSENASDGSHIVLTEDLVARMIGVMVASHAELEEKGAGFGGNSAKIPTSARQVIQQAISSNVRKSTWDVEVFIPVVQELAPGLNWTTVMRSLDYPEFCVYDLKGFEIIIECYRKGSKSKKFPMQVMVGLWKNPRAQYTLLAQAVSSPPDVFNFADYTMAETRKVINPDELAIASSSLNRAPIAALPNQALNSLDVLDTFTRMLAVPECQSDIEQFLQNASQQAPELMLLGLLQLPQPWHPVHSERINALAKEVILGRPTSSFVLPRLWNLNSSIVVTRMVELHHEDPSRLSRLLDVCHELKSLAAILRSTPFSFALDLATLASRREFLNLDKWVVDMIRDHGEAFVNACLDFLKAKITAQLQSQTASNGATLGGAPPVILFSIDVVVVFLHALQSNSSSMSGDMLDKLNDITEQCLQIFPRLANLWTGSADIDDGLPPPSQYMTAPPASAMNPAVAHPMADSENKFTLDIQNEVNGYYESLYRKGTISVQDVVQTLAQLKTSPEPRHRQLYLCMITVLLDEYKYFSGYPDRDLAISATLLGQLVQHDVLPVQSIPVALSYILDALQQNEKGEKKKLFNFGLRALGQFVERVTSFPQFCATIVQLPNLQHAAPEVVALLRQKMAEQERVGLGGGGAGAGAGASVDIAPGMPMPRGPVAGGEGPNGAADKKPFVFQSLVLDAALIEPIAEDQPYESPSEPHQDKILFIINNLSPTNVEAKVKDIQELLEERHCRWFSNYLVVKRACIEPNFHSLYLQFLDTLHSARLNKHVLYETYSSISLLLNSEKTVESSSERSRLKNLGSWLGGLTLAKDKPIRHRHLALKELLIEGYDSQRLLVVIPFVCKVLEQTKSSKVFKPPNPWLMAVLRLLIELHQFAEIKLNLKFEVEVMCKNIAVDLTTIEPSNLLLSRLKAGETRLMDEFEGLSMVDPNIRRMMANSGVPLDVGITNMPMEPHLGPHRSLTTATSHNFAGATIANLASYVVFNPAVTLFATQPALKRLVQLAIERAVREILTPVVERSVTIAGISTRDLIIKDFALEPDEQKMRKAAHMMAQNLAGALASVTCKEPLRLSMATHLRTLLLQNGLSEHTITEQALMLTVNDNLDLACAIVEKSAMEKAVPEIDDALSTAYLKRRQGAETGRPYYDLSAEYSRQRFPNDLPEPLKPKAGNLGAAQQRIYEDFSRIVRTPGLQPSPEMDRSRGGLTAGDGSQTFAFANAATGVHQQEELGGALTLQQSVEKFTQLMAEIESLLSSAGAAAAQSLADLPPSHELRACFRQVPHLLPANADKDELALVYAQKVVQFLYTNDSELARETYVVMLRDLCDQSKQAAKEVLSWLLYADDERKFNVPVTVTILRANLLTIAEQDQQLARLIENGHTAATDFAVKLIRRCILEEPPLGTISDFFNCLDILNRLVQKGSAAENVVKLIEDVRQRADPSGPNALTPEQSALHEQLAYAFAEWVRLYQHPNANEKLFASFIQQLHTLEIFGNDDTFCLFFRVCTELSIDSYARFKPAPGASAVAPYQAIDAYAKLIIMLIKFHEEDGNNPTSRLVFFTKIVSIVVLVLVHSHEMKRQHFNQKPFFRLFAAILNDLNGHEQHFQPIYFFMLQALSNTLHTLQPFFLPGFTFAWLSLVSHRQFMPKLLLIENQKGWPLFRRLLIDLLKFLVPFLRDVKMKEASRLLYKGTLRVLLVLLHDFPEFLCDYHYSLCDVIPPTCVQLRNLVLSAFPRNMRLPDPFTPNLRIDTLPEVKQPPNLLSDYAAVLVSSGIKDDLDAQLSHHDQPQQQQAYITELVSSSLLLTEGQTDDVTDSKYNVPLLNAVVLHIGCLDLETRSADQLPAPNVHVHIFMHLLRQMDSEGCYYLISAIANQLRFPNRHTYYFSSLMLRLFVESRAAETTYIQEQITRVLLERLIVNRPHPWGLLVTFIELIKDPKYSFWEHAFTRCAPDIERLFESVSRSVNHQIIEFDEGRKTDMTGKRLNELAGQTSPRKRIVLGVEGQVNRSIVKHETLGDIVLKTGDTARLRREYAGTRTLDGISGIHVPLAEVTDSTATDKYALAFAADYPPSLSAHSSLANVLRAHSYISVDQALFLLRGTASLLEQVHGRGIVFCNVSPDSLWVSLPAAQAQDWSDIEVSLTDFGYARKSSSDVAALSLDVCGDLRFMSPECTGRTNRPIDARSDIYSLGMLMHAALTGDMPPKDLPILQRVHACLASTPEPLTHASDNMSSAQGKALALQRVLEDMTAKLPEQRFSSCTEVVCCLDELAAFQGNWQDFQPRLSTCHDNLLQTLLADNKLYGRDEEVKQLLLAQKLAHESGKSQVIVVKGPSGVGKTSLVQELMLPTSAVGGLYCVGKHDQYQHHVPYQAVVQACTELVDLLLADDAQTVSAIARAINEQLRDNVWLLLDMLPRLRLLLQAGGVLNSQASLSDKEGHSGEALVSSTQHPERTMQRLHRSFCAMLAIVTAHDRPVTLFVDDVQWADQSSLALINSLVNNLPHHLVLVLAFRSDDDAITLDKLDSCLPDGPESSVSYVRLDCLSAEATQVMLQDMLGHADATTVQLLSSFIYRHTLGNALYLRRVLRLLVECRALTVDTSEQGTPKIVWNEPLAQQIAPSDSAIDLLVHQLQQLPATARGILVVGALLDKTFALHAVADILGIPMPVAAQALQKGVLLGFLSSSNADHTYHAPTATRVEHDDYPLSSHLLCSATHTLQALDGAQLVADGPRYRLAGINRKCLAGAAPPTPEPGSTGFQWRHDKLRQAAAQMLGDNDREQAQYLVGCWQLDRMLAHDDTGLVFDIVIHFESAPTHLRRRQDHINLAKLCIVACAESRARSAFKTALKYGQLAVQHMQGVPWGEGHETQYLAWHSLITVNHDNALYEEMTKHIDYVLQQQLQATERANIQILRITQHISQGRLQEAIQLGLNTLEELGCPVSIAESTLATMVEDTQFDEDGMPLPYVKQIIASQANATCVVRTAKALLLSTWFLAPRTHASLAILMASAAIQAGLYHEAAHGFACLGMMLQERSGMGEMANSFINLALKLVQERQPHPDECSVRSIYASHFQVWCDPIHKDIASFERSVETAQSTLNHEMLTACTAGLFDAKLIAGTAISSLLSESTGYDLRIQALGQTASCPLWPTCLSLLQHLAQDTQPPIVGHWCNTLDTFPFASADPVSCSCFHTNQLLLLLLADDVVQALETVKICHDAIDPRFEHMTTFARFKFLEGVTYARFILQQPVQQQCPSALRKLADIVELHELWASRCPSTFCSPLHLLRGCQMVLQGDSGGGLKCIDQAIDFAEQEGFTYIEAMAHETIGYVFEGVLHCPKLAKPHMISAQQAYQRWGANWKARALDERYNGGTRPSGQRATADVVDMDTINGWTAALGSEGTQDSLVIKFMELAMMHGGSREGRLFWTQREADEDGVDNLHCIASSIGSASVSTTIHPREVLDDSMTALVNYVERTRETLTEDSPKIRAFIKPGSARKGCLLFLPIILRDQCVGVLHLANELTPHNGDSELLRKRIAMMQSLSAQLAVMLENMRLVDKMHASKTALQAETVTLQELVDVRTKENTEINAQLQKLLEASRNAEQLARAASDASRNFLHHMSHELRTPLNAIVGMVEILLEDPALTEDQRDKLETAALATQSLLHIVNNVLDLGKIQAGKMTLASEPFCLRKEVECSMESVAKAAADKKLILATHYAGTVPQSLTGDGVRIGQVLRNLLSNAVKFTERGHVLLEVTATPVPPETGPETDQYTFTIRCTDTGAGIAQEDAHRLFKEFSQVDSSGTRQHGGTGLGLNISLGFARLMQGGLAYERPPSSGRGSTFVFEFLCTSTPCPQQQQQQPPPIVFPPGVHIVACHPSSVVRQMIQSYLTFASRSSAARITCLPPSNLDKALLTLRAEEQNVFIADIETLFKVPSNYPRVVLINEKIVTSSTVAAARMPLHQDTLLRAVAQVCKDVTLHLPESTNQAPRPRFAGLNALVVEDNPVAQKLICSQLQLFGIPRDCAYDGAQAVNACMLKDYNIILMDIQMPKKTGVQATIEIRALLAAAERHQPPIIAQSAHVFDEDIVSYRQAGMNEAITKPLTLDDLQRILLQHFPQNQVARAE
ncbi:CCR4-NOT core subunit cdc39 [Sorochytrium milnesiophthora]